MRRFQIDIANRQAEVACDRRLMRRVLRAVLADSVQGAELSVAVVKDEEMARLNRQYLGCDGPTDVISFLYGAQGDSVEGEVVINAEEAARQAQRLAHGPQEELLLYAVHGVLHLLGYDDADPRDRRRMHERALQALEAAGCRLDARSLLEQ